MSAQNTDATFDPRYDPRFQRGYRGPSGKAFSVAPDRAVTPRADDTATGPSTRVYENSDSSTRAIRAHPQQRDDSTARMEHGTHSTRPDAASADGTPLAEGPWPEPGAHTWVDRDVVRRARGSIRRSIVSLWCIGFALIAVGSGALAVGIRINLSMSGGVDQSSPLLVESDIAWAVVQPTLLVGLGTIVGVIVLQVIVAGRRGRS